MAHDIEEENAQYLLVVTERNSGLGQICGPMLGDSTALRNTQFEIWLRSDGSTWMAPG